MEPIDKQCLTCPFYDRRKSYCLRLGIVVEDPLRPPCAETRLICPDTDTRVYSAETLVYGPPSSHILPPLRLRATALYSRLLKTAGELMRVLQFAASAALIAGRLVTEYVAELISSVNRRIGDPLVALGYTVAIGGIVIAILGSVVGADSLILLGGVMCACGVGVCIGRALIRVMSYYRSPSK